MKNTTLALAALLVGLAGCTTTGNGSRGRTVVLIDVGDSTIQMQKCYQEDLDKLVSSIQLREEVVADTISFNSLGNSNPLSIFFGVPGRDVTTYRDRPAAADAANTLSTWIKSRFAERKLAGSEKRSTRTATDIMSALVNAERLISGKGPDRRRLILFSDMIEQSAMLDLTTVRLESSHIEQHVERLKKEGLIPNLKGIEVWIIGLGAVPDGTMSSSRVAKIRRFWEAYFRSAEATFEPARWGTRLLLRGDE